MHAGGNRIRIRSMCVSVLTGAMDMDLVVMEVDVWSAIMGHSSVESTSATRSGHKSANVMYEFRLFNGNAAFFLCTRWLVWCVGGVFVGDA